MKKPCGQWRKKKPADLATNRLSCVECVGEAVFVRVETLDEDLDSGVLPAPEAIETSTDCDPELFGEHLSLLVRPIRLFEQALDDEERWGVRPGRDAWIMREEDVHLLPLELPELFCYGFDHSCEHGPPFPAGRRRDVVSDNERHLSHLLSLEMVRETAHHNEDLLSSLKILHLRFRMTDVCS